MPRLLKDVVGGKDMKRNNPNGEHTNWCRPSTRQATKSAKSKDLRNAKAQRSIAAVLKNAVHDAMEEKIRRFACVSCSALFRSEDIVRKGPFRCDIVRASTGFTHVLAANECYPGLVITVGYQFHGGAVMDALCVMRSQCDVKMYANVCRWCTRLWRARVKSDRSWDRDNVGNEIATCPILNIVPWSEVPEDIRRIGDMESTVLSCIDRTEGKNIIWGGLRKRT